MSLLPTTLQAEHLLLARKSGEGYWTNLVDGSEVDPLVEIGWFSDLLPPAFVVETNTEVPVCGYNSHGGTCSFLGGQ